MFDVLRSEYEAEAAAFRRAADVLPTLDDIAAYTTAFRQAESSFQTLRAKAFEIRAVTRRPYADYGRDEKLFYNIEKMRMDRLRALEMTVEISGEKAGNTREVVLVALTTALTRLGLTATPGACGTRRYILEVEVKVSCRRGSFGPLCEMGMAGVLVHCVSGRVLAELDLNNKEFRGMHTRDRAKAMEAMYERVTADLLLPRLSAGLATALPIDRVE